MYRKLGRSLIVAFALAFPVAFVAQGCGGGGEKKKDDDNPEKKRFDEWSVLQKPGATSTIDVKVRDVVLKTKKGIMVLPCIVTNNGPDILTKL